MKSVFKLFLTFLLLTLLGSCVEPFTFKQGAFTDLLVVYGAVTDQPGPYTISLTGNTTIDGHQLVPGVKGAHVTITSDAGETDELVEQPGGKYLTTFLQGAVGRTYTLHIVTADGKEYESIPDKMLPVGKFSNLHSKFMLNVLPDTNEPPYNSQESSIDDNAEAEIKNGFNLIIDSEFDPEQQGRAIWRWTGTFEYTTHPEDHGYFLGTKIWIPDPLPCSGVYYDYYRKITTRAHNCTCCVCYHTEHNTSPILSDVRYIDNNRIDSFTVAFIPASPLTLNKKFFIYVEQSSASEQEFDFWKRVQAANQKSSDLFQTPPPAAVGNLKSLSQGGSAVIGLFAAHAVHRDTITLFPSQVPYPLRIPATGTGPCLEFYKNETTSVKPIFF